jgi:DNA-binding transcriptional LysR family regulator
VYDPVTLDQLRAFVTVVEEGSFSAAARKLKRVQSAISTAMANLESQLGVPLWDRTTKVAKLTEQGRAVLGSARRVLEEVDGLRQLTSGMLHGVETRVGLCVDALFPLEALLDLCAAFAKEFPSVDLRVDTEVLSAVSARVLDGTSTLGVVASRGILPGLEHEPLASIEMLAVVSPDHPLSRYAGRVPARELARATQIVLSERSNAGVPDQAVVSSRTWRVADLYTKHMMLRRGLGWGNLPDHIANADIEAKKLVRIWPAPFGDGESRLQFSAVHKASTVFGPAHRWLLAELAVRCRRTPPPSSPERRAGAHQKKR